MRVGHPDWSCLLKQLENLAGEYSKGYGLSRKKVPRDPKKPSFWQKLTFFVRFLNRSESFTPDCEKREKDPLAYAEDIKSYIRKRKEGIEKYYALLEQLFEPKDPPCADFHRKLVSLPFRGVLTTNYDRVLEAALRELDRPSADDNSLVINEDSAGQVDKFLRGLSDGNMQRRIAHLHGRYDNPKSIILSNDDYQQAYDLNLPSATQAQSGPEQTLHQKLLWALLATRSFVFVGFSMNDPYFKRILETVSRDLRRWNRSTHYVVMGISPEGDEYSKAKKLKSDYGISTVFYKVSNGSHQGLDDIVDEIAEECDVRIRSPINDLDWLEQTSRRMEQFMGRRIDNEINREKLLTDLQDFALRGNGVVIGSPGVGKTYSLKKLRQNLKSDGIPHLLLPIDQLGDGTDENLPHGLSNEDNLIARLQAVPVSEQKAVLLFDTFDATRDEQTRKRFLRLIQRAIQELEGQWNVVVTVRTYDAEKSQELLDLFGDLDNTDLIQYHSTGILCRHFTILPLNEEEIRQAFDQVDSLKSLYNKGAKDFRQLLANPFNLWLLEKILKTSQKDLDLSHIHSEVQLLGEFWVRRVESENNEDQRLLVLRRIARRMVDKRLLTVERDKIYEDIDLDKSARQKAWDNLLSDEILAKVSSTGQRIAFSHNILFDYAISVLLIEDEPQQLEDFVHEDPSRSLFLRPSFTYFFTRLWYDNDAPEKFWRAFWHILPSDQSLHLRLFARLIPTSVIANEARSIDQLKPLLERLRNGGEFADEAMTHLLQSLRTLQIGHDTLWCNFFDQVSAHLHPKFAGDLATLTSEMLERAIKNEEEAVINACGRVGRRLLEWIWQEREMNEDDWYNRLGGYQIVPLVAKTYGTNVEESRALLEKVLDLTQEDDFPIEFLTRLTEHIDKIWGRDPEFVGLIYHVVFAHYETSDELRTKGSSILGFGSTRRQDYRMCQYLLIEHFPNFLQAESLYATQAVIQSLNHFVIDLHTRRNLQEGVAFEDLVKTFNFRGNFAYFVGHSGVNIWEEQEYADEPVEMADALFEFIAELAMQANPLLDSLLDIFRDHVRAAFFWKRLLKTAAQFPGIFALNLFELCIARPIQMGNDVLYELCTFLEVAAVEFTPEQRLQIEQSILGLPKEGGENREFLEGRRNRLLAQIPRNLLITDAAKEIWKEIEQGDGVPDDRPLISVSPISWSEPDTDEEWLQKQDVDTTTPENQKLQRFFEPLDKFNSEWLNDVPTESSTELILPALEKGYATITKHAAADKEVIDLLWRKLTACVAILARVADNPDEHLFTLCRRVLLHGAKHELPRPNPILGDQSESLPYYSPYPRHEAARGLLRLTFHQSEAEILDAIEKLASDPVPSVRMVTAMELYMVYFTTPERFWRIVDDRATHETNQVVQKYLYATLIQVVAREEENEEKTTRVMDKLLKRTPPPTKRLKPEDPFTALLMWLAIDRENSWALKAIEDTFFKDPIRFANPLKHAVFRVMEDYVVPKNLETPEGYERAKRAIAWLSRVITVVSGRIEELCTILKEYRNEEVNQQLHDVYEVIDQVIRHLCSEIARDRGESEEEAEEIPDELRCRFYSEVKPLMEKVIDFALNPENGVMFAGTAHYFMQLLTSFLSCNPKEVLHLAEGVVRSSERFGYSLDSLAVEDVVNLVEIVLADHRDEVRDGQGLEDLLNLLDIFAKTGWPEALRLVWRLDEVFR